MSKLYMIGNTHFDPVWLWTWDEAMASIRSTFRSALDRMKEDPEFIYSFATPPVFEWIKKTDPGMFEEIKLRVAEGRWELAEGWWVQPDCYGASGESYVRQGLYAQKYLKENFGQYATCVFNIDSFGHSPQLPQILQKSRIGCYCFVRPEKRHIELESQLFLWQGLDRTEIPTYRAAGAYLKTVADTLARQEHPEEDALLVYGVTNHGGAPTKKLLREIHETEDAEFSTVSRFFAEHSNCDYRVSQELFTGDFGPYSNYPKIRYLNRVAEFALQNAEVSSLWAGRDDRETLEKCWQDVLFNQFHDILGGACIKDAYIDAENSIGRATQTAREIMHYNLQSVTRRIQTVGENPRDIWNLCLWNLNGSPYTGYVEAEVQWAHEFDWYDKGIALEDAQGTRYPCQIIREKSVIPRFRSRFVFHADLPATGYKMFKVVQTGETETRQTIDPHCIETDTLRICFSENGTVHAVYDQETGNKLCDSLLVPVCYYDDGDTWCFNIDGYDNRKNPFLLTESKVIEAGKIRTVLKNTYRFRDSKLELYYTFYRQARYWDLRYRVNWNEKHYVFKLESASTNDHITSVPYGCVSRQESRQDVPMGPWLEAKGITYIADSIFSYNMIDNTLGLTVLRSPIYGDLRIRDIDYEEDYDIISQGISEGKIRISFQGNRFPDSLNFLNPPVVICEANHGGTLPSQNSAWQVTGDNVMVSAAKRSEFDDTLILRMAEYGGSPQSVQLCVGSHLHALEFRPYEIKTLKISENSITEVYMTEDGAWPNY